MSEHSIAPPSSRARHIQCPASLTMEARYPEPEDDADAMAGVAAHWAVAEMLSGRLVEIDQIAPNGVVLTQEMVEGADMMYDDVLRTVRAHGAGLDAVAVEVPVTIARVHPECWGTPDARAWLSTPDDARPTLYLWDYKFGHRLVEVFENAQLVDYVAGACDQVGASDLNPGVNVVMRIVQPRGYHRDGPIREWRTQLWALRGLINISSGAVHRALGPDPQAKVGPECRDCKARHACPTLQRAALSACDEAGKAQPFDLPPAAAGLELSILRRAQAALDARVSGLEQQTLNAIRAGASVPGWTVEPGVGRTKWKLPSSEIIAIGASLQVNVAKPPEAVTPLQAIKAGLLPEIVKEISETPKGPLSLVPDTGAIARSVFSVSN